MREAEKIVNSIAQSDGRRDKSSASSDNLDTTTSVSKLLGSKSRQSLLYKLRQEIVQLTRDVQRLARFIGVQRTGFRKLIKKYTKWSHSSVLSEKFLPVLEAPTSFTNQDFTSTFLELSLLYDVLRQAKLTSISQNGLSSNHVYPSNEKVCTFDCEMVTSISNSAVFWIHPDNMLETKITLLRHLTLVSDSSIHTSPSASNLAVLKGSFEASSVSVPSPSANSETSNGHLNATASNESLDTQSELTISTYLDSAKKFYSVQTNTEPGQIRSVVDLQNDKSSTPVLCSPVGGLRHFCIANLTPEQRKCILKSDFEQLKASTRTMDNISKVAVNWVEKRQAVPIAKVVSQRTRFRYTEKAGAAVGGTQTSGSEASSPSTFMDKPDIWATMDYKIRLTKNGAFKDEFAISETESDITEFPHCVLEIRWKGMEKPSWLSDLEKSHIVYPVKGFSLYSYSVAKYYPDTLSVLPKWLGKIDSEIRRAPPLKAIRKLNKSLTNLQEHGNLAMQQQPVSPGILLNSDRQPLLRTMSAKTAYGSTAMESDSSLYNNKPDQPVVRYWNEFDDPEDGDAGVFVVIPEDDLEDGFFTDTDVEYLVSLGESLYNKLQSIKIAVMKMLGYKVKKRRYHRALSTVYEDEDEDDTEYEGYYSPRFKSHNHHVDNRDDYFVGASRNATSQRDSVLSVLYFTCLFLSVLILMTLVSILLLNDTAADPGFSMATYVVIVAGFFVAVGISVVGMGLFLVRTELPVWWHQMLVFGTFFGIVCFGVGGIAWLFS